MTVAAQSVLWSIAPQAAKVGSGTFTTSNYTWRKFRVPTVTPGGQQNEAIMPLEAGGVTVPTGAYKAGAFVAQMVDLIPRLEDDLGYLLYAAMGAYSGETDMQYTPSGWVPATGVSGHLFRFNPTNHNDVPYLATRLMIPDSTGADLFGEIDYDCKVTSFSLNIPGAGLITANLGIEGCRFAPANDAAVDSWSYANDFEGSGTIAHAGKGSLKIGSTLPKITGLTIDIANVSLDTQREFIVGSFFRDDVTILTRNVSMRAAVRWTNADLWKQIYYNNGSAWDPTPYLVETAGTTKAFYFEAQSPDTIGATIYPHAIRVMANNINVSYEPGSLRLRAGDVIEYGLRITVLDPDDGSDYIQIALDNGASTYTWS